MGRLGEILRADLLTVVNSVARGTSTWEQGNAALPVAKANFEKGWQTCLSSLNAGERERLQNTFKAPLSGINEVFSEVGKLLAVRDRSQLNLFVGNDLDALINPFFKTLLAGTTQAEERSTQDLKTAQSTSNTFTVLIAVIALLGLGVAFGLGAATYRAIMNPLNQMMATVKQIGEGNYDSRTGLTGSDELSELGQAFDNMLGARVTALVQAERENEQLNDSIIHLLQAVSQLTQRDPADVWAETIPYQPAASGVPVEPERPDYQGAGDRGYDSHEDKKAGVTYENLLFQIRPAFGGNIVATIVNPEHRPQMATEGCNEERDS